LFLALVTAQVAHGKLVSVDPSEALKMPGVVGFFDKNDIPGSNHMGFLAKTEPIFAEDKVWGLGTPHKLL
jgi:xanthine dehydrogenase/oxidase